MEKMNSTTKDHHYSPSNYPATPNVIVLSTITPIEAFYTDSACGLSLALSLWISHNFYSLNLITHPSLTLRLLTVIQAVVVTSLYSLIRHDHSKWAVVIAFGTIVLGAPAIHHFWRTVNWSLLMSVLTVVPAACVYGLSWTDWHRIFAQTKPGGPRDYMICLPAHGAVIGAWFGAWPMPLDWERSWQEWAICVTYGAIAGYIFGLVASFVFTLFHNRRERIKGD